MINPKSIVVPGGSNDIPKPGGKILKTLIESNFAGEFYVSNPKETEVQGMKSYQKHKDLQDVEMAILTIAAKYTLQTIGELAYLKGTKAFNIISAGFCEESEADKSLK